VSPLQPIELRKRNPREGDPDDAIIVSLIAGVATVESRVVLGLIGQILSVLAFDDLRTERQLGYIVNAGVGQISNVQYVSIIVQGHTARADQMEVAVEHVYFELMPERLRNLTEQEFRTYKDSFKQQLLQPPASRSEEFKHHWSHILNGGECFGLLNKMLDYLDRTLTSKDPLVEAWNSISSPSVSLARQKVMVKYFAGKVVPRPSRNEFSYMLFEGGLSQEAIECLGMEHNRTKVLYVADSARRKAIAKSGGYFPTTVHCTRGPSSKRTKEKRKPAATDSNFTLPNLLERRPDSVLMLQGKSVRGNKEGFRSFLQPEG